MFFIPLIVDGNIKTCKGIREACLPFTFEELTMNKIALGVVGLIILSSCAKTALNETTLVIGHRGGVTVYPENTLDAFQHAIDTGVTMIEFDLRQTADGEIICYHDHHIPAGEISNLTYAEIQSYASNEGFYVPTYQEMLELTAGKILLDVEIKEAGYEQEVVEMTERYFNTDQFVVTSFKDEVVKIVKEIDSQITVGLLLGVGGAGLGTRLSEIFFMKRLKACGADFIAPNYKFAKVLLNRAGRHNIPVAFWTVNDSELIEQFLDDPRVMAVITDDPQTAMSLE